MEFKATFRIGAKEASDFYIYQALHTRYIGVISFGLLGALICYLFCGSIIPSQALLIAASVLAFFLAASITIFFIIVSVQVKVKLAMKKNNTGDYDQTIEINGFGVRTEANDKDVRINFEKIKSVRETKTAFYIYLNKDHAWILPKEQLKNPEEDCAVIRKIFDTVIPSKQLHFMK